MSDTIEVNFKRVLEQVFSNWTALQLAVENGMGGPTSHQTAVDAMNWLSNYCLAQADLQVSDLTEVIEDILDEEFSTICEDNSPREIAHLLVKFLTYLKQENFQQFEADFNSLPVCKIWLSKAVESAQQTSTLPTIENEMFLPDKEMEVDPEWTVVHRRKK